MKESLQLADFASFPVLLWRRRKCSRSMIYSFCHFYLASLIYNHYASAVWLGIPTNTFPLFSITRHTWSRMHSSLPLTLRNEQVTTAERACLYFWARHQYRKKPSTHFTKLFSSKRFSQSSMPEFLTEWKHCIQHLYHAVFHSLLKVMRHTTLFCNSGWW